MVTIIVLLLIYSSIHPVFYCYRKRVPVRNLKHFLLAFLYPKGRFEIQGDPVHVTESFIISCSLQRDLLMLYYYNYDY